MNNNTTALIRIEQLSSHINRDVLTALLLIRHASAEDTPEKTPWHMVAQAAGENYICAITFALRLALPPSSMRRYLEESIQSVKSKEAVPGEIIELLSDISLDDNFLSQIYEHRLSKETWRVSLVSGDFYTPSYMIHLLLDLLDINEDGSLYDPCCGSGAMLFRANLLTPQNVKLDLYGQTVEQFSYQICQELFYLNDISVDLGDRHANTLTEDIHAGQKFDYILSNPPFNHTRWYDNIYSEDKRWEYGFPPRSNANYAWLQHIVHHLSDDGRAVVVLPNGVLTTQTGTERGIRQGFLRDGLIEAVITLPANLFYNTRIPCCIWILGKARQPGASTLLVDAGKFSLTGEKEFDREHMDRLTKVVLQHRNESLEGKTDWYAVASLEDIAERNYILSPNLYIQVPEISLEPLRQRQRRFVELGSVLERMLRGESLLEHIVQWEHVQPSTHWEKAPLSALYSVSGGLVKRREAFGHGTEMVDVKTVIHNMFLPDTFSSRVDVTEEEFRKYQIKAGDILINRTSETIAQLACACVVPAERNVVYGGYIKRLRPIGEDFLYPYYMAAYFRSGIYRQEIEKVSPVYTTRANMNMERISRIFVYYPDSVMQKMLGDTLFAIFQYQKECYDENRKELLRQYTELLIERFVTYPVLCARKKEVDGR